MNNLINTLDSITEKVIDYRYINAGGCCLYAYLIAEQLEKRKISYRVYIEYPSYPKETYYEQARNKTKRLSIQHVFLRIQNNFYYDYKGVLRKWNTQKVGLNMNSSELLNMYNNGAWNPLFKRFTSETDIKKIKKVIKEEFKKYDERVKNSV